MRRGLGRGDAAVQAGPALGCVIVGGGPAALAPLVAASRQGSLAEFLAEGVAVVERSASIGAGKIGCYVIWSDSTADSFLTAVRDHRDPKLSAVWSSGMCDRLRSIGYGPVSLAEAASLQREVGRVLHSAILKAGGAVHVEHEALHAQRTARGWRTRVKSVAGHVHEIESRSLVIGTGGYQPISRLWSETVASSPLLPRFQDKLVQSDEVLAFGGIEAIEPRLAQNPKVAIVGGSTSAVAAADLLVRALPDRWGPSSITIMHRRPLRVFFHSVDDARHNGYTDFGPQDVCPVTGYVYRLAGLRQRSKDLLVRVCGIGSPREEFRVDLHRLREDDVEASQRILEEADLIVAALGYRPRGFLLCDEEGLPIPLLAGEAGGDLVDQRCRVLDRHSQPIDGVFGIGLASGFELDAAMGGEASFRGQANGLWLWQNDIGLRIAEAVLDRCEPETVRTAQHPGAAARAYEADGTRCLVGATVAPVVQQAP